MCTNQSAKMHVNECDGGFKVLHRLQKAQRRNRTNLEAIQHIYVVNTLK